MTKCTRRECDSRAWWISAHYFDYSSFITEIALVYRACFAISAFVDFKQLQNNIKKYIHNLTVMQTLQMTEKLNYRELARIILDKSVLVS